MLKHFTWTWEHSPLTGQEKIIHLAIAEIADYAGYFSYADIPAIVLKARTQEAAVKRLLALSKNQLFVVTPEGAEWQFLMPGVVETIKKVAERKPEPGNDPDFTKFWANYPAHPRKKDRKGARAEWTLALQKDSAETIINALKAQVAANQWGDDLTYLPAPERWLSKERWADQLKGETVVPKSALDRFMEDS